MCLLAAGLLLPGCLTPINTRLPSLVPSHPSVEKRSYERHDPFPDRWLGPDTQVRPRGFNNQRTEPRRALEERLFQGNAAQRPGPANGPDIRGSKYRNSVRY